MNSISKLELIGEGLREIVYFDDMKYELNGSTLKVYLTNQNQDKILPLSTESLKEKEETIEEDTNESVEIEEEQNAEHTEN